MSQAIFCDWKTGNPNLKTCHFFEIEDLKGYDIIFFDPLLFAARVGLRHNIDDIWEAEYVPRNEMEFVRYLAKVKAISSKIKSFLNDGGVWVIRSNFPNTQIRMRKKNSFRPGEYTESLISAFFWLEQFIGKYAFRFTTDDAIYFRDKKNALFRKLHKYPVSCFQTQDQIPVPGVKVIAETINDKKLPVITRVNFGNYGEIYFLPHFDIENETEILADAFDEVLKENRIGVKRPSWLINYEDKLNLVSPYVGEIKEIEAIIGKLRRRKLTAQQRQTELMTFVDLLYTEGDELRHSVETALKMLGFDFPEMPSDIKNAGFSLFASAPMSPRMPVYIYASPDEPPEPYLLEEIRDIAAGTEYNPEIKPIMIINAPYAIPPEDRIERIPAEIRGQGNGLKPCILTTLHLFQMVCYLIGQNGSDDTEKTAQALRKLILETDGFLEFNKTQFNPGVSSKF